MSLVPKMVDGKQEIRDGKLVWINEDGEEVLTDPEASTPPPTATPPQDTYMSEEQVRELLAKVRKEEKEKLYPQIERLNEKLAMQEQLIGSFQEQLKGKDAETSADKKKVIDENSQLKEIAATLQSQIDNLTTELTRQKEESIAKERQLVLDNYKERKLREAGEEIIPELVQGGSEAEIDQNIAYAKKRFRELIKKDQSASADARAKDIQQTPTTGPTSPPPEIPDTLSENDREAIKSMSPQQLREYKKKLGIPLMPAESSIAGRRSGGGR